MQIYSKKTNKNNKICNIYVLNNKLNFVSLTMYLCYFVIHGLALLICLSLIVFQDYDKFGLRFPNFNFNVSHHGDYVAIASEPVCLVG